MSQENVALVSSRGRRRGPSYFNEVNIAFGLPLRIAGKG